MAVLQRVVAVAFAASCLAIAPMSAHAQTPDWKTILNDVDGVVVYCLAAKPREYSRDMCGELSQAAVKAFEGRGLKADATGVVYAGVDVKPEDPTDPAPLKQSGAMAKPLVVRLLVTGTDGFSPGVTIGITISRSFRAAIEAGASGPGLAGDLVFYDRQWIAEGPRRKVMSFLVDYSSRQFGDLAASMRPGP